MTTIYHNPHCRKSRETLQILENAGEDIQLIKYLENPPSEVKLRELLQQLNMKPLELVRKGENIWKEQFKGKPYSEEELITIMSQNPKLIERPIVVKNGKAVIGRPPESVKEIL